MLQALSAQTTTPDELAEIQQLIDDYREEPDNDRRWPGHSVHFLWQGALIGAGRLLVVLRTTGLAASARYATGIVALAAMLAAPLDDVRGARVDATAD